MGNKPEGVLCFIAACALQQQGNLKVGKLPIQVFIVPTCLSPVCDLWAIHLASFPTPSLSAQFWV